RSRRAALRGGYRRAHEHRGRRAARRARAASSDGPRAAVCVGAACRGEAAIPLAGCRRGGRSDGEWFPDPTRRAGLRRGPRAGGGALRRRRRRRVGLGDVLRAGLGLAAVVVAFSYGDLADLALAVFLVAVGLGLGWAFLRLAVTFDRLSSLIRGAEREVLPVINKVGGTVDRVNAQLDKLDTATDSAVDAVEAVDEAVRSVSFAVKRPVQKLTGLWAGVSHGLSAFKTRRDWRSAMEAGKAAAVRRERDLDEDVSAAHE